MQYPYVGRTENGDNIHSPYNSSTQLFPNQNVDINTPTPAPGNPHPAKNPHGFSTEEQANLLAYNNQLANSTPVKTNNKKKYPQDKIKQATYNYSQKKKKLAADLTNQSNRNIELDRKNKPIVELNKLLVEDGKTPYQLYPYDWTKKKVDAKVADKDKTHYFSGSAGIGSTSNTRTGYVYTSGGQTYVSKEHYDKVNMAKHLAAQDQQRKDDDAELDAREAGQVKGASSIKGIANSARGRLNGIRKKKFDLGKFTTDTRPELNYLANLLGSARSDHDGSDPYKKYNQERQGQEQQENALELERIKQAGKFKSASSGKFGKNRMYPFPNGMKVPTNDLSKKDIVILKKIGSFEQDLDGVKDTLDFKTDDGKSLDELTIHELAGLSVKGDTNAANFVALLANLKISYNSNIADLGALSGGDLMLIEAVIGTFNPAKFSGAASAIASVQNMFGLKSKKQAKMELAKANGASGAQLKAVMQRLTKLASDSKNGVSKYYGEIGY